MKVYVITKGSYSDYHIEGVMLNEDDAKKFAIEHTDQYDIAYVEEYDTDEYKIESNDAPILYVSGQIDLYTNDLKDPYTTAYPVKDTGNHQLDKIIFEELYDKEHIYMFTRSYDLEGSKEKLKKMFDESKVNSINERVFRVMLNPFSNRYEIITLGKTYINEFTKGLVERSYDTDTILFDRCCDYPYIITIAKSGKEAEEKFIEIYEKYKNK